MAKPPACQSPKQGGRSRAGCVQRISMSVLRTASRAASHTASRPALWPTGSYRARQRKPVRQVKPASQLSPAERKRHVDRRDGARRLPCDAPQLDCTDTSGRPPAQEKPVQDTALNTADCPKQKVLEARPPEQPQGRFGRPAPQVGLGKSEDPHQDGGKKFQDRPSTLAGALAEATVLAVGLILNGS